MRGADPVAKARKALEGFDEIVAKGLAALKVPGAAIAIVKDKEVILAKGYGFRDVEGKLPVTADTLMAIGSSTKAFTAFTLGTLVDQGKVEWDKPVRNYIPWFRLYDAQAGERLTPRDLVTHRSGLPRHDLVWYNNTTASREDLVRALAFLPPDGRPPREVAVQQPHVPDRGLSRRDDDRPELGGGRAEARSSRRSA